ncbi:MAG: universal stress protein [Cytophagales bacterium]
MNIILVPTNFSQVANFATDTAISIAEKTSSKVELLHMIPNKNTLSIELKPSSEVPSNSDPELNEAIKKAFKSYLKICESNKKSSVEINLLIRCGNDVKKLTNAISTHSADLIVMGTQEVQGYETDMLIGENTRTLTKEAQAPVLCIKKKIKDFNPKHIVFATNFKQSHFEELSDLKKKFFDAYDAHVSVVYVNTPENFATTRKLTKIFQSHKKSLKLENVSLHIYNDTSRGGGIVNFSEDVQADLVIMPTQGRKGIGYFLNGSISEQVLDDSKTPVITFVSK